MPSIKFAVKLYTAFLASRGFYSPSGKSTAPESEFKHVIATGPNETCANPKPHYGAALLLRLLFAVTFDVFFSSFEHLGAMIKASRLPVHVAA